MQAKRFKLIPLLFLSLFIISIAFEAVYASFYVQASLSSVRAKPSSTVSFEGVTLTFSSAKPFYAAGEKAVFYIDVLNLRDQPIYRIDFSLKVKALSFFGLQVMKINDYSTRTFNPGKPERITIERVMPIATPPGFFALELEAKPESMNSLPSATIIIYVKSSKTVFIAPLTASIFSMVAFCFSIFIAYTSLEDLKRSLPSRKFKVGFRLGRFMLSAGIKLPALKDSTIRNLGILMLLIEDKIYATISAFSIGQKFVFTGICVLIAAAFALSLGLEQFANQLAILTYFALVIGVGNLIYENLEVKRLAKFKSRIPSRIFLSLFIFNLLIYLSNMPIMFMASIFASLIISINLVRKGQS
jgi:hypothetical protein